MTADNEPRKDDNATISDIIRENMIANAVSFLKNPKIVESPLYKKIQFLIKKGFSEKEIEVALERAELGQVTKIASSSVGIDAERIKGRSWLKIGYTLIAMGLTFYGLYHLYQNYIKKRMFKNNRKKNSSIEANINDINLSLANLQASLSTVTHQLREISIGGDTTQHIALNDLKSEVMSIKSILLSRHQFPAIPQVNPTIPQWQLEMNVDKDDTKEESAAMENGEKDQMDNDTSEINGGNIEHGESDA